MTRPSLRYFYALSACLLAALIPVVVHSYLRVEVNDCKGTLFLPQFTPTSISAQKHDAWMRETFQSSQWNEGSFERDGLRFDYSIIRSYDPKRLYHHPENYFVDRAFWLSRDLEWVPADSGTLPIHRAYYRQTDPAAVVAYLLVYRSAPVASPYWAQLRAAPVLLFRGRYPMTLFFIQAHGSPGRSAEMENIAREWLRSAWENYCSVCIE